MFTARDSVFKLNADSTGIALTLERQVFSNALKGQIDGAGLVQLATLRLLEEQELAERILNGFYIGSIAAVQLDAETRELLLLPDPWLGSFTVQCRGSTYDTRFTLQLALIRPNSADAGRYDLKGPLIKISDQETYLPSYAQWRALDAVHRHAEQRRVKGVTSEVENLTAIHEIQAARDEGAQIDLGPFGELRVDKPQRVGLSVIEDTKGGLELVPSFGVAGDPISIRQRLGQVEARAEGSIRIGDRIVILDKARMRSVKEIVENRRIAPDQAKSFLTNPSAYIDAALVDLDLGFSMRVKGAAVFRLAYFGQTESSEVDWFSDTGTSIKLHIGPSGLRELIHDSASLHRFEELFSEARSVGAQELIWSENANFRFDTPEAIESELEKIREELRGMEPASTRDTGEAEDETDREVGTDTTSECDDATIVVDIEEYDEGTLDIHDAPQSWLDVIEGTALNTNNLKLTPYNYQIQGIQWIHSLAKRSLGLESDTCMFGGLLADDMGLGKTLMALAAIEQYFLLCRESREIERPVLVVAPLSLLENWKEEVEKVFHRSPFSEIVILQSDADLPKFRVPGGGRETSQNVNVLHASGMEGLARIKYSLYVGDENPTRRLDMPARLVLTSYQTLRDYQFSLSRVDWSFLVFDEAQNIKNPNALQSRAAKALKARFRLVVTGTPVENELRDFWCLFDTARPALLGTYQSFRKKYVRRILNADEGSKIDIRLEVGRELRERVGGLMLRRLKDDMLEGLPEKTVRVGADITTAGEIFAPELAASMPPEQLERYEAVVARVRETLENEQERGAALAGLHHLRAVSLHPDCLAGGAPTIVRDKKKIKAEFRRSGKLSIVLDTLEEIRSRHEKVIIYCINKRMQVFLSECLQSFFGFPVHIVNGDTAAVAKTRFGTTRKKLIASFEARDGFGIIIMSPIAAGVGLTVVGANNVIHLERHWNPAKESQATDRVYRIGQEKPVNIYIPVLHHPSTASFDVNLATLLSKKTGLRNAIVTADSVTPEEFIERGIFGFSTQPSGSRVRIERLDAMGWSYFEAFIGALLKKAYAATVYLTGLNDKGCDVVVLPSTGPGRLVQCKHTLAKKLKGYTAINQVVGAKPVYESMFGRTFEVLEVFTNARDYDREAQATARMSSVALRAYKDIGKLLSSYPVTDNDILSVLEAPRLGKDQRQPDFAP